MENTRRELDELKKSVDEIYSRLGIEGDFPVRNELNTGTIFGKETWGFYPSLTGEGEINYIQYYLRAFARRLFFLN